MTRAVESAIDRSLAGNIELIIGSAVNRNSARSETKHIAPRLRCFNSWLSVGFTDCFYLSSCQHRH